ncbi:MAG: DNA-protecting protein DprA, partial [Proteobacteria bacterium]|nr:DNA-protecting protein DprA [Pseudomonadota bacterium]
MADADPHSAIDRLRLLRTPHIGPVTYRQLIQRFGSAGAALDALPMLAARGGRRDFRPAALADVQRELAMIDRLGALPLLVDVPSYTALRRQMESAPPMLTLRGSLDLLRRPV